ncbi:MAG: hypothetical protein HY905_25725 [Deltaproteobacteria bacterium]|nr:hypothetical protein [Deltaproteobacteria bacterium]
MMRNAGSWGLALLGLAASAATGCGGSARCDPACRPGFECYYGICAPAAPTDGGVDTTGDVAEAEDVIPPGDEGVGETVEIIDVIDTHETGTCTGPGDCGDGDLCTQDLCDTVTGNCYHPPAPDGTGCEDDFDSCTNDVCRGGYCAHESTGDCCSRDADCMWPDHLWECDTATGTCYDPPQGEFCAPCTNRSNCGDGGDASDDLCVWYTTASHGCSKDCLDDLDCPGAAICWFTDGESVNRPCEPTDSGCLCASRLGSCEPISRFGDFCMADAMCRTCGPPCDVLVCPSGYCTWNCDTDADCVWGAVCDGGVCVTG